MSKTLSLFLEGDPFLYSVVSESMHRTDDNFLAVVFAEGYACDRSELFRSVGMKNSSICRDGRVRRLRMLIDVLESPRGS